jgi:hypothetical protein
MQDSKANGFSGVDTDFYQVFGAPNQTGSPERRLLLAILERAILDYVGNDPREVEEATTWIFEEASPPQRSFFSFGWVCEQLDLDAKQIAEKIRAMPRRGNRKVAPWYFSRSPVLAQ